MGAVNATTEDASGFPEGALSVVVVSVTGGLSAVVALSVVMVSVAGAVLRVLHAAREIGNTKLTMRKMLWDLSNEMCFIARANEERGCCNDCFALSKKQNAGCLSFAMLRVLAACGVFCMGQW